MYFHVLTASSNVTDITDLMIKAVGSSETSARTIVFRRCQSREHHQANVE